MPFGGIFSSKDKGDNRPAEFPAGAGVNLPEDQRELLARDVSMLDDKSGLKSQKLQADAEKTVISAVENSIKELRVVELGRCPICGSHIFQHLGANICEACGWHQYDQPRLGKVLLHLKDESESTVLGERAYVLKNGDCLLVDNGVVIEQIPSGSYSRIEYLWEDSELEQRHLEAERKLEIPCGWCGKTTNPTQDGFHLVHAAFGSTQERYCFCCDDCYEAFRKMYPARVHRNCYERDCRECNLCLKRYDDEASEIRILAKDHIKIR